MQFQTYLKDLKEFFDSEGILFHIMTPCYVLYTAVQYTVTVVDAFIFHCILLYLGSQEVMQEPSRAYKVTSV